MRLIWCCTCRNEEEVSQELFYSFGAPYQCPGCKEVFVSARNGYGVRVWLHIEKREAEFQNLMTVPELDEDEDLPSELTEGTDK